MESRRQPPPERGRAMKVYISSTFSDLREYRAAAADVLRKLGHDVRGMEIYVAEGSRPVDVCEADARSCDVLVLLLAWRYGYVPTSQSRVPPLSITELEYLAALSSSTTEVLPFLVGAEAPWPAHRMDAITKEQDGARIEAFRRRVSEAHIISTFSTPDELAREVASAIRRAEATQRLAERTLRSANRAQLSRILAAGSRIADTTQGSVVDAIIDAASAEVFVVDVGNGQTWWSTRLYLLASLAADLTSIRQLLFTGHDFEIFGLSPPAMVRDRLAAVFPELGKYERLIKTSKLNDARDEANRRLDKWNQFFHDPNSETATRVWVRSDLLEEWFGDYLIQGAITVDRRVGLTVSQVQQILDWPWPYVPIRGLPPRAKEVGSNDDAAVPIVVSRDAFARKLAREWVAREMPRNPTS